MAINSSLVHIEWQLVSAFEYFSTVHILASIEVQQVTGLDPMVSCQVVTTVMLL